MMKQDLVVIVYEQDIVLLKNFVRSVGVFTPDYWNKKWIVVTDRTNIDFVDTTWTVIYAHDLFEPITGEPRAGYINQQIAKLAISQQITSEWYWVFDAKNFLVRSITDDDLYHLGRARVNVTEPSPEWKESWESARDFYGIGYPYLPIHNRCPYPVHTESAQELTGVDNVANFAEFFYNAWTIYGICEFFLYNARVLGDERFIELYYPDERAFNTTIWPKDLDREIYRPKHLRVMIEHYQRSNMPIWSTGLHRTAIVAMTDDQKSEWKQFMTELGLFDDLEQAEHWFRDQWFTVLAESRTEV